MALPFDHTPERMPVCADPQPFDLAPDVCRGCGNLLDVHIGYHNTNDEAHERTNRAMWHVMLTLGAPYNKYTGGPAPTEADAVRAHLANCAIDYAWTHEPAMAELHKFYDTHSSGTVEILSGQLWCACNKYRQLSYAVADLTLGELIWHAARADPDAFPAPPGHTAR